MISLKTAEEIKVLAEGGKILSAILGQAAKMAKPGTATSDIDIFVKNEIRVFGGEPAFLGYGGEKNPYPNTICISVNDEVVHGISLPDKVLHEGDVVGLDVGMKYPAADPGRRGMFTDMAMTVGVGKTDKSSEKLIEVTKSALFKGLKEIKPGKSLAAIGKAVQAYVEKNGFNVVRDLVGHGVGYDVHEEPRVPNYFDAELESIKLKEWMVLAVEPMVTSGGWRVRETADGWTIKTADGSNAAHFEVTIAVTKNGYQILTPLP